MPTASRSAAERVFAIAEILEEIVLHVIQNELEDPFVQRKVSHITTSFALQRVSRDAYRNIAGSTKIRELALIRPGTSELDTWDRIRWLSYASSKWRLESRTRMDRDGGQVEFGHIIHLAPSLREARLDHNLDASWRALRCLPTGTPPVKLEIWQSVPTCFWNRGMNSNPAEDDMGVRNGEFWRKRLTRWKVKEQHTLGQLYIALLKVELEQNRAFAKGRDEYEERVAVAKGYTGSKLGRRDAR